MLFLFQMSPSLNVRKLELNTGHADQKKDSLITQLHLQGGFDIFQKRFQFHSLSPKYIELK